MIVLAFGLGGCTTAKDEPAGSAGAESQKEVPATPAPSPKPKPTPRPSPKPTPVPQPTPTPEESNVHRDFPPMTPAEDRALGAFIGLVAGDVVGVPLKGKPRPANERTVRGVEGDPRLYGGMRPGEYTDISSMALGLAESLLETGGFDAYDVMDKWNSWRLRGYLSSRPDNDRWREQQIGNTIEQALRSYTQTQDPYAGRKIFQDTGKGVPSNGTIMRLAPVALYFHRDLRRAIEVAGLQSETTHGHPAASDAARVLAHILVSGINGAGAGADKEAFLTGRDLDWNALNLWDRSIAHLFGEKSGWKRLTRDRLNDPHAGSARFTLECALWAIHRTQNFREAVLDAVNLGRDADAVGAVTGQIAGAIYGLAGIPQEWRNRIVHYPQILRLGRMLFHRGWLQAEYQKGHPNEPFRPVVFPEPRVEPAPTPAPQPSPEPTPEPTPEPKPAPKAEPKPKEGASPKKRGAKTRAQAGAQERRAKAGRRVS